MASKSVSKIYSDWLSSKSKGDMRFYSSEEFRKDYTIKEMPAKSKMFMTRALKDVHCVLRLLSQSNSSRAEVRVLSLGCGPGSDLLGILNALKSSLEIQDIDPSWRNGWLSCFCLGVDVVNWSRTSFKKTVRKMTQQKVFLRVQSQFVQQDINSFVISCLSKNGTAFKAFDFICLSFVEADLFLTLLGTELPQLLSEFGRILVLDNNIQSVRRLTDYGYTCSFSGSKICMYSRGRNEHRSVLSETAANLLSYQVISSYYANSELAGYLEAAGGTKNFNVSMATTERKGRIENQENSLGKPRRRRNRRKRKSKPASEAMTKSCSTKSASGAETKSASGAGTKSSSTKSASGAVASSCSKKSASGASFSTTNGPGLKAFQTSSTLFVNKNVHQKITVGTQTPDWFQTVTSHAKKSQENVTSTASGALICQNSDKCGPLATETKTALPFTTLNVERQISHASASSREQTMCPREPVVPQNPAKESAYFKAGLVPFAHQEVRAQRLGIFAALRKAIQRALWSGCCCCCMHKG